MVGFSDPDLIFTEADGYAPALLGGPVNCKWASFAYTDTTAKELFTLPEGAQIVGWIVAPTTGFDGTTPVLDLGDGTTADRFVADLALPADTGVITEGFDGDQMFSALTEETTVYATYAEASGGTAGVANVGVLFVVVAE